MSGADQSLRPLLAQLKAAERLATVREPVDPMTDLAAVALKIREERGRASLFENVKDAEGWRVAAQCLADRAGWSLALGHSAASLLPTLCGRLGKIEQIEIARATAPAASQNLGLDLPIPHAAERDSGPQMVAVAIAQDPVTGRDCLGLTRHRWLSDGHFSVQNLCPSLQKIRQAHRTAGTPMPLALVSGVHPAVLLAAALGTWMPTDLALAGSLMGEPVRVFRGAHDLLLPADAEFVLEGDISAYETCDPGLLGTVFGTYQEEHRSPVFVQHNSSQRADPIFHALHLGGPGDYAGALCLAAEILMAQHIRNIEGGIDFIDISCLPETGGLVVVLKLRARMEGQAKTALMGALSGIANWAKFAIAVDEDVDIQDLRDVFWSSASRTHAEKDVGMIDGLRALVSDLASPLDTESGERLATRWFIDSTMPPLSQAKAREDFARAIPKNLSETDLADFLPKA